MLNQENLDAVKGVFITIAVIAFVLGMILIIAGLIIG